MPNPTVSFVVPCYKLAHLLPACLQSILAQSYRDFEILILDDASPDHTAEVAASFRDDRIRYIRNDRNIGHLHNYNKGIQASRGRYVWLISADDYLRRPYVLERYVQILETHPRAGYVFCPGVGVVRGGETGLLRYSSFGNADQIVTGHHFLKRLLHHNFIIAASAMARRECYDLSLFPLNEGMGWSGDWYLWCVFALRFDVAYCAEPMVCYRQHDLSMTSVLTTEENVRQCSTGDIEVPWMVRRKAAELGAHSVSDACLQAVAREYVRQGASRHYQGFSGGSRFSFSTTEFEASLASHTRNERERNWVRARFYAGSGDASLRRGDFAEAGRSYLAALCRDPLMAKAYGKLLLLALGKPGQQIRSLLRGRPEHSSEAGPG